MMNRLIDWISKLRLVLLAGWIAAAMVSTLALPSLSVIVSQTEQNFIPKQAESAQALKLLHEIDPAAKSRTSAVIVLSRQEGISSDDKAWMTKITNDISSRKDELNIAGLLDAQTQPELAERFLSKDGRAMLAVVYLPYSDFDEATRTTLMRIEQLLEDAPDGA
ncbi:MAG: MMPL family transporter, partial [Cohnella sp.]|nr:MMPL family transporter [Cohnella sp.]